MSFLGFDAVSTLAEEVRGGDRKLVGRAILRGLVLAAVLFVATTWVSESHARVPHRGSGGGGL